MINRWLYSFAEKPKFPLASMILRKALFVVALLLSIINLTYAGEFYGVDSFVNYIHFYGNPSKWLVQCLNFKPVSGFWWIIYGLQIMVLIFGIFGIWKKVMPFLIYLFTLILIYKTIDITNAGHQLLYLLLFYQLFFVEDANKPLPFWRILIGNLSFLACGLQVAFLYAIAGYTKLLGNHWLIGDAFYLVTQIPEYSHPILKSVFEDLPWLSYPISWAVMGYQMLFPILIWVKPTRNFLLGIGVFFHLGIAFFTGIFDFGIIMIASYFAFLSEAKAQLYFDKFRFCIQKAGNSIISAKGD